MTSNIILNLSKQHQKHPIIRYILPVTSTGLATSTPRCLFIKILHLLLYKRPRQSMTKQIVETSEHFFCSLHKSLPFDIDRWQRVINVMCKSNFYAWHMQAWMITSNNARIIDILFVQRDGRLTWLGKVLIVVSTKLTIIWSKKIKI